MAALDSSGDMHQNPAAIRIMAKTDSRGQDTKNRLSSSATSDCLAGW